MDRKRLLRIADAFTEQIEQINLKEQFSPNIGEAVQRFEWMIYIEGGPRPVAGPPKNGSEAHDRLMSVTDHLLLTEATVRLLDGEGRFD
jgi:hypothetical protein